MPQLIPLLATVVAPGAAAAAASTTFLNTILGRLLLTVATTALNAALAPKTRTPGIKTTATAAGGTNPASFILGRYATGGYAVTPAMSHGKVGKTPNAYLTYVIELGDIPGQTIERLIIDDQFVEIGEQAEPEFGLPLAGDYAGRAWIRYHDGTQTEADAGLLAAYGDYPERPWSADMVGTGLNYAILTFRYDRKIFNGLPRVRFVCGGIPLYDPRQDDSVGGSGQQRWQDPSTWSPSENPIVQIYNVKRGIALPDGTIYGGGVSAQGLPLANWFAAMNVCDMGVVSLEGGDTEPQYRAGYEVTVDETPADVIEQLLKSCSGQIAEIGGVWKVRVGGPGLPVYLFTDADLIVSRSQEMDPFPSLSRTWNGVHATYPEPESLWESKDAPPRYNATWEVEDQGRRLVADLALPTVPYETQVQRLMQAYIEEERRFRRHVLTLPPEAMVLEPLDAVAWTSARNGYTAKVFEVAEVVDELTTCLQKVSLKERDGADYGWVPSLYISSSRAPIGLVTPVVQTVPGWAVSAVDLQDGAATARRPAIRLAWDGTLEDARGLMWEMRLTASAEIVARGEVADFEAGFAILSEGVLANSAYQLRGQLTVARPTAWTAWTDVLTSDIRLGIPDLADTVQDAISTAQQSADAAGQAAADALTDALAAVETLQTDIVTPALERLKDDIPRIYDAEDAVDELVQSLTDARLQLGLLEAQVADAGVYVEPATGLVRIAGIVSVGDRIGAAEVRIDGAEAAINLRATYAEVNAAITSAVIDPSRIPVLDDIELRLGEAEVAIDGQSASITSLAGHLEVSGQIVTMSDVVADLDAINQEISLKLDTVTFDALGLDARLGAAEIELSNLDAPTITQAVQASRTLADEIDDTDQLTLANALGQVLADQSARTADAAARQSIRASIEDDFTATAEAVLQLQADLSGAVSLIGQEQSVRASETLALANDIETLSATLEDPATGLDATAAALGAVVSQVSDGATGLVANATRIGVVEAVIADPSTGLSATQARIDTVESAIAEPGVGLVARTTDLEAAVADTNAALGVEQTVRSDETTALAAQIATLSGQVTDPETGLAARGTVLDSLVVEVGDQGDDIGATIARVDSLETSVNDPSTGLNATVARLGTVEVALTDPVSGLAVRTSDLEARAGTSEASVQQLETAVADIEGNQAASLVLRARAGGAVGEIEVVAASDPTGAGSAVTISADTFTFAGGLALFEGAALASANYVYGQSGWIIRDDGSAQFAQVDDLRQYSVANTWNVWVTAQRGGIVAIPGPGDQLAPEVTDVDFVFADRPVVIDASVSVYLGSGTYNGSVYFVDPNAPTKTKIELLFEYFDGTSWGLLSSPNVFIPASYSGEEYFISFKVATDFATVDPRSIQRLRVRAAMLTSTDHPTPQVLVDHCYVQFTQELK